MKAFPSYLDESVKDGRLQVYSNGRMTYSLKGVHARVSVTWNYRAPETHRSILRGSRSSLVIRQDQEENDQSTLYIEARQGSDIAASLTKAVSETLQARYPGIGLQPISEGRWRVEIPASFRVGHEAHFGQVMERYLRYLAQGKLPDWEVPNMIVKYHTTTEALRMALR